MIDLRRRRLLLSCSALFLVSAACASNGSTNGSDGSSGSEVSSGADDEPMETTTVRIAKPQDNISDLAYYAAVDLGYFEDLGVEVEMMPFEAGADAANAYIGGAADFAIIGTEHAINIAREGQESIALLLFHNKNIYALVADSDSEWSSLDEMGGTQVGITGFGSITDALIRADLENHGMTDNDLEIVSIGGVGAQLAAIQADQVDAGMILDPFISVGLADGDIKIISDYRELDYPLLSLQARPSLIEEDPDLVARVVTGFQNALNDVRTDLGVAQEAYDARWAEEFADMELSEDIVANMLEGTQGVYAEDGILDEELYNQLLEMLELAGHAAVADQPTYDEVVDMSFAS